MTEFKDFCMRMHWRFFTRKGLRYCAGAIIYRIRVFFLTLKDYCIACKKRGMTKGLWTQLYFHRFYRSPIMIDRVFTVTFRVAVTYRCNLECLNCYARGLAGTMLGDMTLENFAKVVDWSKKNGWTFIRFLGGEPTINPHFREMVGVCYSKNMNMSMASNLLCAQDVIQVLRRDRMKWLSVNYSYDVLRQEQKDVFLANLAQIKEKRIPFEFSYTLNGMNGCDTKLLEHAALFRPIAIRVSLAVPGLSSETTVPEMVKKFQLIKEQIFALQKECMILHVPFYLYRPLPRCLFEPAEWEALKGVFPCVCYTRCPLGARGDYTNTLVVNPDLSVFPCVSVFVKGPNILTCNNRDDINHFFARPIKEMIRQPMMSSCEDCDYHKAFCEDLGGLRDQDSGSVYSEHICQGSCLSFNKDSQSLCHSE